MTSSAALAQEAFLRRFHDAAPGITARALRAGHVAGGGSSYDAVARRVGALAAEVVVDLGCGDGELLARLAGSRRIGLDLSRAELAAAAARRDGAALIVGRAQALPLGDAVADVVVSHLGFTLMAEPAQVAAEVARVLRPGGRFITVVGGGPRGDDAYAGFLDLLAPLVRAAVAAGAPPVPRLGELAARSEAGLRRLFAGAHGWAAVTVEDLEVDLSGTPDEVWARVTGLCYELDGLPAPVVAALHARFVAACPRWRRDDGAIQCTMACSLVEAVRQD